jgi:hypothetical protein
MRPNYTARRNYSLFVLTTLPAIFIMAFLVQTPSVRAAAEPGQKVFATPEEAVAAAATALTQNDHPTLIEIFGKDSKGLLQSGDPVEDANEIKTFLDAYKQMHRFRVGPDGKLYLLVGAENWPMPIPLAQGSSGWYFDTPYGKKEFLYRRIGDNENTAIEILQAIVAAENEYHDGSEGGAKEYAAHLISTPGQRNGLAWRGDDGKPAGPMAALDTIALAEGYSAPKPGQSVPVHGYYFRILDKQGANATGGTKDYVVDGKMINGFAVLAYPAKYRSSGVMTFLAGPDGSIYERDLGPATAHLAPAITSYNPDSSWSPTD